MRANWEKTAQSCRSRPPSLWLQSFWSSLHRLELSISAAAPSRQTAAAVMTHDTHPLSLVSFHLTAPPSLPLSLHPLFFPRPMAEWQGWESEAVMTRKCCSRSHVHRKPRPGLSGTNVNKRRSLREKERKRESEGEKVRKRVQTESKLPYWLSECILRAFDNKDGGNDSEYQNICYGKMKTLRMETSYRAQEWDVILISHPLH